MANARILGAPNLARTSLAKLTGGTCEADMPIDNLLNAEPSKRMRTTLNTQRQTWLAFTFDSNLIFDSFALANVNFGRGAKVRVVIDNGTGLAFARPREATPNGSSVTNTAGSHTALDEGVSTPGIDWIGPTTPASNWGMTLDFTTPLSNLRTGASRQSFEMQVRLAGSSTKLNTYPTIKAELYESGVFKADLGTKYVSHTIGQYLNWEFDAVLLSAISGANCQLKFTCTPADGGNYYVQANVAGWIYETQQDTFSAGIHDYGWVDAYQELPYSGWGGYRPRKSGWTKNFLWTNPDGQSTTNTCYVLIRNDQTPTDIIPVTEQVLVPDTFFQAGCLVIGSVFSPEMNVAPSEQLGVLPLSTKRRSQGGQLSGSRRPVLRTITFNWQDLTALEAHSLYERIYLPGPLEAYVVSLFPDDATEGKMATLYCTPESFGDMAQPFPNPQDKTMKITFVEKR